MNGEMVEHLDFTRADSDRITRMETLLIGMDQKMDDLTNSVKCCQTNCGTRRAGVDKRVKDLEDQHKEEGGILKGRKADVALIISVVGLIAILIGIWRNLTL
jgi:hypothetical protein